MKLSDKDYNSLIAKYATFIHILHNKYNLKYECKQVIKIMIDKN